MRHKFEDIAINSIAKRKPTEDDMPTYIGLEHLDAGDLRVTRYGSKVPITGEKLLMQTGDVLFGRRNTYLKRAAIAPHDGLFSAHGMILRPKEDVVDKEFFPFFIASDYFFDAAIRISVGSISPTVNWGTLKELEFDLPTIDEQRKLADLLWAAVEARTAYKELLAKTDELVKAQFEEMFGDSTTNPMDWDMKRLDEYILFLTSGSRGWSEYFSEDGEMFITIKNVKNRSISTENMQYIQAPDTQEAKRTRVKEGDLLISITADLGRTGVVNAEIADYGAYINQHLSLVRLDQTRLNPHFVSQYLETDAGKVQFESKNQVGVKAGLNFNAINSLIIIVPPMELQNQYVTFVEAAEKSKAELHRTLDELDATYKALLREHLG